MTDAEYADRLEALAVAALRKNQPRQYQLSWAEIAYSGLHNSAELQYAAACSPAVVLRLLRRLKRNDPLATRAIQPPGASAAPG